LLATTLMQKQARRAADAHGGRIVKFTGDGALLVFEHATDAASAVRELHASFERDAQVLGLPPLKLHSGVSWGDFVDVRGADIYGHTVNIASRVADSAAEGEILVTSQFTQALGRFEPAPMHVGERRFRNVPDPVVRLRL
jgi:adenylate cyclase